MLRPADVTTCDGIPLHGRDFLWRHARLVVEVDGREYHATKRGFQRDRRRDRRLALAGYETRRYSAREVTKEPERVVAEIRAFLAGARR